MTRLRIVVDESTEVPQTRAGQRLLAGYAVPVSTPASVVLADVVALLVDAEDTAEDEHEHVLAVIVGLARLYGVALDRLAFGLGA